MNSEKYLILLILASNFVRRFSESDFWADFQSPNPSEERAPLLNRPEHILGGCPESDSWVDLNLPENLTLENLPEM